ncbi:hypothetical protein AB0368_07750 [Actinoplanes sp. NPDC051475]|uniref:hypothetical protein n=1 Tax=Actinoplanes sp. NPDC051475 TaxID=3157225 RepID=UPI00344E3F0D
MIGGAELPNEANRCLDLDDEPSPAADLPCGPLILASSLYFHADGHTEVDLSACEGEPTQKGLLP